MSGHDQLLGLYMPLDVKNQVLTFYSIGASEVEGPLLLRIVMGNLRR